MKCNPSFVVSTSIVLAVTALPTFALPAAPSPVVPSNPRTADPLLNPMVPIPVTNAP